MNHAEKIKQADDMMGAGRFVETAEILEEVLAGETVPENPGELHSKLGFVYIRTGRQQDAIDSFHKAIECDETLVKAYQNLCLAYTQAGDPEKAVKYGEQGLRHGSRSPELLKALALAKRANADVAGALELLEKASEIQKNNPVILMNLGALLYESGRKHEAKEFLEQAVALRPDYVTAQRMISRVHRYTKDDPYLKQLQELRDTEGHSLGDAAEVAFALAKAYEDIEEYEKAYEEIKRGNALVRGTMLYSHDKTRSFIDRIKQTFPAEHVKELLARAPQPKPVSPIFIVGMPRSGTSLVEQILASHTQVYGAGELQALPDVLFTEYALNRDDFKTAWEALGDGQYQQMAQSYLNKLPETESGEPYITDKMPLNFLYCGAILTMFPDAKIIHCKRDPRAICLSVFKTYFPVNVPFANDEKELAQYYRLYEDMMAHWQDVMPDAIHYVQYEEMVEHPEENIRALLAYCGLEWQDACLEFHKTKRPVITASALQVKAPMYKGAVEHWRNFEDFMDSAILDLAKD